MTCGRSQVQVLYRPPDQSSGTIWVPELFANAVQAGQGRRGRDGIPSSAALPHPTISAGFRGASSRSCSF
nr:MAG TPA: hypothetical protein [Caudoviricetes sp.]